MLEIYEALLKRFGPQEWWPMSGRFSPPEWEVEVGAILTQNAAWKNVEKALDNLIREGITRKKDILRVHEKKLAELIIPSGYYNQKARKLRILAGFSGKPTRESLLSLWGIGPETADSILLYAYGVPEFVVDAYTRRIFTRLGILSGKETYSEVKEVFESRIPADVELYKEFHALIVRLAKENCRTKPECGGCPLEGRCGYKMLGTSTN
jgi:endonuclease-3 related protein